MKRYFLAILGILIISVFTGCVSTSDGDETSENGMESGMIDEYYVIDELIDAFNESIVDADAEQFAGIFRSDAVHYVHTEDGEKVISGRGAIESQAEFAWNFIPDDGYDMPEPEMFSEDTGREIHFVYKDLGIRQILYVEKNEELWGASELTTEFYEPYEIAGPLQKWADTDGNGEFDEKELIGFLEKTGSMFLREHNVANPFDKAFDADGDGFISRSETELFRQLCFGLILPSIFLSYPEYAEDVADIDGDGMVSEQEISAVQEYLAVAHPDSLPEKNILETVLPIVDADSDGIVSKDEHADYFYDITEQILLYPFPASPLETLFNGGLSSAAAFGVIGGYAKFIDGRRIAVLAFENTSAPDDREQTEALSRYVENAFVATKRVTVVDRNDIDKVMAEHSFQAQGLTDEETAIKIGKLAGTELIATGVFGRVDGTYYLQLRLIDVETGEVVGSSISETEKKSALNEMCADAVNRLF